MKIRPKEIPIFLNGGVSGVGRTSDDWYNDVHVHQMDAILNRLKKYGEADDYMYWLNSMLDAHSYIYGNNKDRMDRPIKDLYVEKYQRAYSGDNNYYPYLNYKNPQSRWQLQNGDNDDYNQYGIKKSFENGIFTYPGKRTSGDNPNLGYNPDGYFSGITDYRRLLGRKGDYTPELLSAFKKLLNDIGYDIYEDTNDVNGYYKLKRLPNNNTAQNNPPSQDNVTRGTDPNNLNTGNGELNGSVGVKKLADPESKWKIFGDRLKSAAPDILDALRLAGNLHNNERVYDAVLKGIRPNLQQTYNTYRQVVGDEATKQAYYRRGIAGLTKAGLAFTSDADRLMAYLMEAKRAADELKAQGDLADNAEIRRTSDESNQHAWGNVQRATEVANRNLIEMNNANAAKWNLKALKYSADWTNWDNYLMGIQNRWQQKKEEDKGFLRQLAALSVLNDYLNDPQLNSLLMLRLEFYNQYQTATDPTVKSSLEQKILLKNREISTRKLELDKQALRKAYGVQVVKSGSKIEYKYKRDGDKYLYKTSRDVVEHFRAMSRMSDESRLKSRTRPIKLSDHPKGNTRKYLLGGVAPFTIYRPLGIGGESVIGSQTTSSGSSKSSSSSSSGKDDAAKNKLDLVKELFKSLKGLPVDVNMAYKDIYSLFEKSKLFGEELSTDDIAGIYLNSMRAISLLLYGQEAYEKAKALATSNEALNEYAVTSDGSYVVSDKDGNLSYKKNLKEIEESGLVPITNLQLINMRAYSPNMVGLRGDTIIENVIGNGMGINKIGDQIKALAGKIGTSESKLDGISQVESNKVKQGLQILAGAPDGYYKITKENKTLLAQVNAALTYIENMLSPALKAILNAHGGTKPLIQAFLTSQLDSTYNVSIQPLTGKASDKNKGENDKEGSEGLKLDAATALVTGKGYNTNIELNTGSNYAVNVKARYSEFLKHSGENMGAGITMLEASTSTLKGVLDWNKATLGGSTLNPTAYNYIILNNGEVVGVDLPTKSNDKNTPDFEMLKKLELLDEQLLVEGIEDSPLNWKKINEICSRLLLPPKYDNLGNLNKLSWNRFVAFLVTTTEKALNDKKVILDMLGVADEQTRSFYENIIQDKLKDKKYSLDSGWPIFGGKEELYQGTVFIPIKSNLVAGAISSGLKISMTDATDLELRQRGYDKLKISTYKKNELVI